MKAKEIVDIKKHLSATWSLGKTIHNGYGGCIFILKDQPDKLLKVCHTKTDQSVSMKKFENLFKYTQKQNNLSVVNVFDYGRFTINKKTYFYYSMQKLKPLSITDKWFFISMIDSFYKSGKKIPEFFSSNFIKFLQAANSFKYKYYDLHTNNIMMDDNGNYKFIDLESFVFNY